MRSAWLRENLLVAHVTTNARHVLSVHEHMRRNKAQTWISFAAFCMRCRCCSLCQQCWFKPHFSWTPQEKVYKSVGLRSGDRGGHDTGSSGTRPIQRPAECLPNHSRTARLKCAAAASCKNHIRCRVRNETSSSSQGKYLRINCRYRGPVILMVRYKGQWNDLVWFRSTCLWKFIMPSLAKLHTHVTRSLARTAGSSAHWGSSHSQKTSWAPVTASSSGGDKNMVLYRIFGNRTDKWYFISHSLHKLFLIINVNAKTSCHLHYSFDYMFRTYNVHHQVKYISLKTFHYHNVIW
jgi:hypothetical protein